MHIIQIFGYNHKVFDLNNNNIVRINYYEMTTYIMHVIFFSSFYVILFTSSYSL